MKRRTWLVAGVILLLLGLMANSIRVATRLQDVAVTFVGYQADVDRGWMAVFRATNGTSYQVDCQPSFQSGTNGPLSEIPLLPASKILAAHSGVTWLYPVPDTNVVRQLRIECEEQRKTTLERLIEWYERRRRKEPGIFVMPRQRREYAVTCTTEVRRPTP